MGGLVFPPISVGARGGNELGNRFVFPGTYATRPSTLRALFMDVATEFGDLCLNGQTRRARRAMLSSVSSITGAQMSDKGNKGTDQQDPPRKPESGGHAGAGRSGKEGMGSEKPSDKLGSHKPDEKPDEKNDKA